MRHFDQHTARGANCATRGLTPLVLVMTVVALPTSWLGFHLGNKMHGGLSATAVRWVCGAYRPGYWLGRAQPDLARARATSFLW